MDTLGVWGVAALMLLENVFPPIPSEVVMPLAGFSAAQGDMALWAAIAAGSLGSLAGAVAWYYAGKWIGLERVKGFAEGRGRWLGFRAKEVDRGMDVFVRHGRLTVLVGRLVPGVRTFISLPAGICGMRLDAFLLFTGVGTVAWTAALAWAGYALGDNWDRVEGYVAPVGYVVLGLFVLYLGWRIVRHQRRKRARREGAARG